MAIGFVISAMVRNADRAMTMAPFVLIIQLLFSGILFKLEGASNIIAWFTISKWSVESMGSVAALNDLPREIQKVMPAGINPEYRFYSSFDHLAVNWLILLSMTVICGVICTLLLRSLSSDSR